MLHIHPNARTTPATRAEIARSVESSSIVAQRYGVGAETVRKWRKRGAKEVSPPDTPLVAYARRLEGD